MIPVVKTFLRGSLDAGRTIPLPPSNPGDLLVVTYVNNGPFSPAPPLGWSILAGENDAGETPVSTLIVYQKVAVGGDTFTFAGSESRTGVYISLVVG